MDTLVLEQTVKSKIIIAISFCVSMKLGLSSYGNGTDLQHLKATCQGEYFNSTMKSARLEKNYIIRSLVIPSTYIINVKKLTVTRWMGQVATIGERDQFSNSDPVNTQPVFLLQHCPPIPFSSSRQIKLIPSVSYEILINSRHFTVMPDSLLSHRSP